jgi:hypothetical protein
MSVHNVCNEELLAMWKSGNKKGVIENLAVRHAAVAVTFIVQNAQDKELSLTDANIIANMLIDDLMEMRDKFGLSSLEAPHLQLRRGGDRPHWTAEQEIS